MSKQIKDFFVYSTGRVDVAPLSSVTTNIAIQADADFEILKLTFSADNSGSAINNNTYPIPNVGVLITDSGSGRQLSNIAVPLEALFGIGKEPFILSLPRVLSARSNLAITLSSFEAAVTNSISLNFIGNKIFNY